MIADYFGRSRLPHPRQSTPRKGGGHCDDVPSMPEAVRKLVGRLDDGKMDLRFCYEAKPCGYGLYRQLTMMGYDCSVAAASRQRRPRITCTRSNSTLWSRRVVAHVSRSRCVMTDHLPTLWKTLLLTLCLGPATLATIRCVRLYSVRYASDVRSETT
jgi:hypothetical protein